MHASRHVLFWQHPHFQDRFARVARVIEDLREIASLAVQRRVPGIETVVRDLEEAARSELHLLDRSVGANILGSAVTLAVRHGLVGPPVTDPHLDARGIGHRSSQTSLRRSRSMTP